MKHIIKNTLKSITAFMVIAAAVITGNIANTTSTVTAATVTIGTIIDGTTNSKLKNNSTVSLKLGSVKRLLIQDGDGEDIVDEYKWSSSDKTVVKVEKDFFDEENSNDVCVIITAVGTGTATITGKGQGLHLDITMTVNVTLPKATAKQKKCKHVYKITKAATCQRSGIKTCKKCKFQKEIKQVAHKYVNKTITETRWDYYTHTIYCENCQFTCTVKYDDEGNTAPDSDYPNYSAAIDAMDKHIVSVPHAEIIAPGLIAWGNWFEYAGYIPYGPGHTVTRTSRQCKWCGKEKNPEKTLDEKIAEKEQKQAQ